MSQTNILLEAGTNELEVVEFYLDEVEEVPGQESVHYRGYYGVNVAKVLEIIKLPKVTGMPEVSHPSVMGAFNLRNHIISLVDLAKWLHKSRVERESPKVIVTEFNQVTTGFLVSGVTRIHRMSWESVEAPTEYVTTLSADSITGVIKLEDRIVFLLDLEKIVTDINPRLGLRLDTTVDWSTKTRYRALVADDSALVRDMLRDLLEKAGFDVEVVTTGKDAWDRLVSIKAKAEEEGRKVTDYIQAVISDIEMPAMDGHNLCKRVKDDNVLKVLPVILFSSLITDKLRHKGEAVGADGQISKPEVGRMALLAKSLIEERMAKPTDSAA